MRRAILIVAVVVIVGLMIAGYTCHMMASG
jgi:hypothetical protein